MTSPTERSAPTWGQYALIALMRPSSPRNITIRPSRKSTPMTFPTGTSDDHAIAYQDCVKTPFSPSAGTGRHTRRLCAAGTSILAADKSESLGIANPSSTRLFAQSSAVNDIQNAIGVDQVQHGLGGLLGIALL